ncbi:MAG: ATP-binding protein [Gemmataceae bacterium]
MTGDGNRGNPARPSEPRCPFAAGTGENGQPPPPASSAEAEPPRMTLAELQRQVEERTAALRRANEALRLDESRLQTLLRLTEMTEASEREVTHFAMEEGIRLTGSKVGYLAFLNEDETVLTMHAWSKSAMAECAMIEKPIVYPVCNTGLWGEAVRQRRPIITNDYAAPNPWVKGTPPGHIKLTRHMNIPVFDGRRIVAVAGVANKETSYDDSDVTQLRLLMDGMWQLLLRRRAEEELRRHRDHLEELVAARTAELRRAHDELKREVDERTQVQEQLRLAKDAAEAANRAKSEFLATMSHEIRTPMNGILGMTELALETVLTAEQRDYLQMVRKSADALLAVINAILDFSKIEAGKLELERSPFALREVLGDTLSALALRAHQKGLELAADVSEEVPDALVGDPGRLRQVLVNLVGNAIKFTEHGEVVIRVRPGDPADCRLHFSVRDTGIGIPAEKQRLLFQPFTQVDGSLTRKYEGTGLGLAISARLVQMMGGQITVISAPGQGSTFQFTAGFERQAGGGERRLPAGRRLRGLPVLVVDDNATNRRIRENPSTHRGLKPTASTGRPLPWPRSTPPTAPALRSRWSCSTTRCRRSTASTGGADPGAPGVG